MKTNHHHLQLHRAAQTVDLPLQFLELPTKLLISYSRQLHSNSKQKQIHSMIFWDKYLDSEDSLVIEVIKARLLLSRME